MSTKELLEKHSHITLCPISSNPEKPSFKNLQTEEQRGRDYICWYGDQRSPPQVGELFGLVRGFARKRSEGEGEVTFYKVTAKLDPAAAPDDWVDPKRDRDVVVLEKIDHTDTWCNVSEIISGKSEFTRYGHARTPMLAGMKRRIIRK